MDNQAQTTSRVNIPAKSWLLGLWEESSRMGGPQQVYIKLGHIPPESRADKNKIAYHSSTESSTESTIYAGSPTAKSNLSQFWSGMEQAAAAGFITGSSAAKINSLRQDYNKVFAEKYDFWSDITVVCHENEDAARAALENLVILPTQGFFNMKLGPTGAGDIKTLGDLMKSDLIKSKLTKEQVAQMEKFSIEAKKAMAKTKLPTDTFKQDKLFGYDAVFMEAPNPKKQNVAPPKPYKKGGMGGSMGINFPPLPKYTEAEPATLKMCQGVRVKNYLITGALLGAMNHTPSGSKPCYSLTKFKTQTKVENIEGQTYKTKMVIPEASTYAQEGYVYREEIEKMLNNLFALLAN